MTMSVNDAGTWKNATPYVNDAGVWKPVVEGWVNDAGLWRQFFSNYNISLSPKPLNFTTSAASFNADVNAIINSGVGPYQYLWTFDSNPGGFTTSGGTNRSACTFVRSGMVAGNTYTAVARCSVTDTGASKAYADIVNLSFRCV